MEGEIDAQIFAGGARKRPEISGLCVFAGAGGSLENEGSFQLGGGFGDALNDLHIVDVESADRVSAFVGLHQHFFGVYKSHFKDPFVVTLFQCKYYTTLGLYIKR